MSCGSSCVIKVQSETPETVTTVVDNGDGTFTYTNENGDQVTVSYCCDDVVTTLIANPDGTYLYTSEDGTQTVIQFANSVSTVTPIVTDHAIATHENGDGVTETIYETVTSFVDNGDGTFTYTSENGTVTTTDTPVNSAVVDQNVGGQQIAEHTSGDGTVTPINETVTVFVNNGDGTFSYTSEDGTVTTTEAHIPSSATQVVSGHQIATHDDGNGTVTPIEETVTTFADNGDGTYTYISEDGTVTTTATPIYSGFQFTNNGDGTYTITHTSGDGTVTSGVIDVNEIDMDINSLVVNGSVLTFTAEDGTAVTVDICGIVAANCSDALVVNADGSVTHTAVDGTVVVIPAPVNSAVVDQNVGQRLIATHTSGDGTVTPINETVTTFTDNGDGTYTYTSEDGTVTTTTNPDLCDWIADPAVAKCDVTSVLATDGTDCGPVALEDIQRNHIFSQCSLPDQIVDTLIPTTIPRNVTMTQQSSDQIGQLVVGGTNDVDPALISPWTIPIPASTPGKVQWLEVSAGGHRFIGTPFWSGGNPYVATLSNPTGDVSNVTLKNSQREWREGSDNHTINQDLWALEPTGTAGGTVDITFTNAPALTPPDFYEGVVHYTVWEASDSGGPLTVADFGTAVQTSANHPTRPGSNMWTGTGADSDPIDMGGCDALYFGFGRHVKPSAAANGNNDAPSDWSSTNNAATIEVTDISTRDSWQTCQMGITAGIIPGGSGPVTFTWAHNNQAGTFDTNADTMAGWAAIPLTSCAPLSFDQATVTGCQQSFINDCLGDAKLTANITGSAVLTVDAGANLSVTAVINGVVQPGSTVSYDNTAGTTAVTLGLPVNYFWCDTTLVLPNGTTNLDVDFLVTEANGTGGVSQVALNGVIINGELTHV